MFQTINIRTAQRRHVHLIEIPFTWNALIEAVADKEEVLPHQLRLIYSGEVLRYQPEAEDGQPYVFQQLEPTVDVILSL